MDENKKKGFPTWAIALLVVLGVVVVGCPLLSIVAAIAIPSLLRSRIAANESSAVGTMRSLVTTQSHWRQTDADRNGVSDYWTADVSGFYRIERAPGQGPVSSVDIALAQADDDKFADGGPVAGRPGKDPKSVGAGLLALSRTAPRSGYFFRAMKLNADGEPYAADADGDGNAWTHDSEFGFQARTEKYDQAGGGVTTFIVSEAGVIYGMDFGDSLPGNAESWPGMNPTASGWRVVQ